MAKLTPVNTPFLEISDQASITYWERNRRNSQETQTVLYLFKQSQVSQNHFLSRFERMKIFNLIGLLMQVGADECNFQFKNSSPDSVRIALRPQLHVRITTKKEFAVTPRSHHLGTFRLQIRVESKFPAEPGFHEPPTWWTDRMGPIFSKCYWSGPGPRFLNLFRSGFGQWISG